MHKQTYGLYKYPVAIVRQYTLIMTITPSLLSYTDIGRHILYTIKMCNTYEEKSNKVHGRRKITAST